MMKKILFLAILFLILGCQEKSYTFDKKTNGITYRKAGDFKGFKKFDMVHIVKGGVILDDFEVITLLTIKGIESDVVVRNLKNDKETLIDKTTNAYVSIEKINSLELKNYSKADVFLKQATIDDLELDSLANMVIVDSHLKKVKIKNINELKLINCQIDEITSDNFNQLIIENTKIDISTLNNDKIKIIK